MSSLGTNPPLFQTRLNALDLPALCVESQETLRRVRVFLFGVAQGGFWVKTALAGYTPQIHSSGIFLTSWLSGERAFGDWREVQALRPVREPNFPELVEKVHLFYSQWQPRLQTLIADVEDEDAQAELTTLMIDQENSYPTKTQQAKAFAQRLRALCRVPEYGVLWEKLIAWQILPELEAFESTLHDLQEAIRQAPLSEQELEDIQHFREQCAEQVQSWLDDRLEQFSEFDGSDLAILGLGQVVPPPGFDAPISMLAKIDYGPKV
jgi:hypothetical protein